MPSATTTWHPSTEQIAATPGSIALLHACTGNNISWLRVRCHSFSSQPHASQAHMQSQQRLQRCSTGTPIVAVTAHGFCNSLPLTNRKRWTMNGPCNTIVDRVATCFKKNGRVVHNYVSTTSLVRLCEATGSVLEIKMRKDIDSSLAQLAVQQLASAEALKTRARVSHNKGILDSKVPRTSCPRTAIHTTIMHRCSTRRAYEAKGISNRLLAKEATSSRSATRLQARCTSPASSSRHRPAVLLLSRCPRTGADACWYDASGGPHDPSAP